LLAAIVRSVREKRTPSGAVYAAIQGLVQQGHYLNDTLPRIGDSVDGLFSESASGLLRSSKLEDVNTGASDPRKMVLGDQDSGL